jgi:hypothetical protein
VGDVLGVDPGRRGAAALLRGSKLVAAASWRPSTRNRVSGFRVRSYPDDARAFVESFHELGSWLSLRLRARSLGAWTLAVEEAVVARNVAVSIKIARSAGELSGPLSAYALGATSWVRAAAWRKRVLGLSPWTGRASAKGASVEYVPQLVEGFEGAEALLGSSEDLADAAGIALWLSLTEEDR